MALTRKISGVLFGAVKANYINYVPSCSIIYSNKKGVSRDFLAFIQQPIDLSLPSILRWLKKKSLERLKNDQKYMYERHEFLGPDLAAAHFIVARGGAVKFVGDDHWIEQTNQGNHKLPKFYVKDIYLEGIDCTGTCVMYESFDNFAYLRKLKYLKLSQCEYIDDWCLDRIANQFSNSVIHLDLSGCTKITERGLAVLHKMKNLKTLELNAMPGVKHKPMVGLLLEEMLPECKIVGLDFTKMLNYEWEPVTDIPSYLYELERDNTDPVHKLLEPGKKASNPIHDKAIS